MKAPRQRSAKSVRLDAMTTALYRFFNTAGELLYIGISNAVPTRLDQHEDTKRWYHEVARVTVEHHPNRPTALVYEEAAIKAEKPKYNIVHNHGRSRFTFDAAGQWTYFSRRSGYERTTDLFLLPELDCSAMVDDVHYLDGEGQLQAYVEYIEENHPEWLEADAVPILWSVSGRGTFENAPFQSGHFGPDGKWGIREDFLSFFTWPRNVATGADADWFKLPLRHRFPDFAQALAWTPSPLQPACPLRSILASRNGIEHRPQRTHS